MTVIDHSALAGRLSDVLGPDRLDQTPTVDVSGVTPALIARPDSVEALAACVRIASDTGAAVVPCGGGTAQRIGLPPQRLDLLLETAALPTEVAWEPADLTASLGAGMTLAAAQAKLAEAGQQLGIDAPQAERATLGGLASTNSIGPRRWLYGGWRDQVIGMQMATATGDVIKSGGRVVKNVQGYDLTKLFIGSLGTLGVITRINLRTLPLPARRTLLAGRGERDAVAAFLDAVAGSQLRVSTIDLLDESCAQICGLNASGWFGLVLVEGMAAVVEATLVRLRSMANLHGLQAEIVTSMDLDGVWTRWVDLDRTDDLRGDEALMSIACLPSELLSALESLAAAAATTGVRAQCWARAGNGLVYARLSAARTEPGAALVRLQQQLLSSWPRTTLAAGDPAVQRSALPWGAAPQGAGLMQTIKRRFDPLGTLQPRRFVAGI